MSKHTVTLTLAEAHALYKLAEERTEGLLTDEVAGRAYSGGKRGMDRAAQACNKLRSTIQEVRA